MAQAGLNLEPQLANRSRLSACTSEYRVQHDDADNTADTAGDETFSDFEGHMSLWSGLWMAKNR